MEASTNQTKIQTNHKNVFKVLKNLGRDKTVSEDTDIISILLFTVFMIKKKLWLPNTATTAISVAIPTPTLFKIMDVSI